MISTLLLSLMLLRGSPFQQRAAGITLTVSGVVVVEGGESLPILSRKIYVFAASGETASFVIQADRTVRVKGGGAAALVSADGTFQLRGLNSGLYSVKLVTGLGPELPDGYKVKSIVMDDRDVLKQKLQIPAPAGKSLRITIGVP